MFAPLVLLKLNINKMKTNKNIKIALLGITVCAAVSYAVTKSDISRATDAIAGSGKLVSNSIIDLPPTDGPAPEAWKIFRWKIWSYAGQGFVSAFSGAAGAKMYNKYVGRTMVDVTEALQENYRLAQREALLDVLN